MCDGLLTAIRLDQLSVDTIHKIASDAVRGRKWQPRTCRRIDWLRYARTHETQTLRPGTCNRYLP